MRLRSQEDGLLDIRLTIDELLSCRSVLREVCEGMNFSEKDFQNIFGVDRPNALDLLTQMSNAIDRLGFGSGEPGSP
jgi:hypothetical protein